MKFVILPNNLIINLDQVTAIYIQPHFPTPSSATPKKRGGKIMIQFAEYADNSDEVVYNTYEDYEEAVVALSALADKLGATQLV